MNTKTAIISLQGLAIMDKPKFLKTVEYNDEKQLIDHLKDLQRGYHEKGDGSPKIKRLEQEINGKIRKAIDCYGEHSDWHYVALLGYRFNSDSGKPYEILH